MSLNFNYQNVITRLDAMGLDGDACCTDPADETKIHPVLNELIWKCMVLDMPGITEKNVKEFWYRLCLFQMTSDSPSLASAEEDIHLTQMDVARYIGLSTNVSFKPRAAWLLAMFGEGYRLYGRRKNIDDDSAFIRTRKIRQSK